jgi:hypothetical protein
MKVMTLRMSSALAQSYDSLTNFLLYSRLFSHNFVNENIFWFGVQISPQEIVLVVNVDSNNATVYSYLYRLHILYGTLSDKIAQT